MATPVAAVAWPTGATGPLNLLKNVNGDLLRNVTRSILLLNFFK